MARIDSTLALGAVEGLLQLCNEILETVRLEMHTATVPLEAFDLQTLVDGVINLVRPTAIEKGLTLQSAIDNSIPRYLFGSARYLSKSLLNLVSNALKFTDKGSINVSIELTHAINEPFKKGDQITLLIKVSDTGIGIPRDKFETIFEHFSRLNPSYQGNYKGYGLGLNTVKQYVEAMNGFITVDSIVDQGTTFTLQLSFTVDDHTDNTVPVIEKPVDIKKRVVKVPSVADESLPFDNTRILVVEDHIMAVMAVKRTLGECGCRSIIDVASTGEIALKKASEDNYDLILMDIGLPKMQGTEVTQKIRALNDPIKSKVPIVALTGHGDPEHKKEFIDLGMNDLMIKPASVATMTRVLEAYVFPKSNALSKEMENTSPNTYPVFDRAAMLKLDNVKGDENAIQEYLSLLSVELKVTKKILIEAYQNNDEKGLRAELHRVRGALTYVLTPELTHTMKVFHDAVRAKPQNPKRLQETYQAAIAAIGHFQQAHAKGFKA